MESKNYQAILSLGYLYIVILGILKEAFYYSQLGVDYFKYSTITDILLSPLSDITKSVFGIIMLILLLFLTFALPIWMVKWKDKTWVKNSFKINPDHDTADVKKHLSNFFILLFCLGLMGFYIGAGIGSGFKISNHMKNETLKFEDKLNFINGDIETVSLFGKTSSFIFYLPEGESEIKITPINNGLLKSITEKK